MKQWQSRYFELAGLYLKYFERAFPRTPDNVRGVIYLDELTSLQDALPTFSDADAFDCVETTRQTVVLATIAIGINV